MNVLFLCTGNSCRSILAEAIFNHLAPSGWHAISAGSKPTGYVHPRALALLAREGLAIGGFESKSWAHLPVTPDIVITVCSSAAGETCPVYLNAAILVHWGVEDPAFVTGPDAKIDAAFVKVYSVLYRRIHAFFTLPLESLKLDNVVFKAKLESIATMT